MAYKNNNSELPKKISEDKQIVIKYPKNVSQNLNGL